MREVIWLVPRSIFIDFDEATLMDMRNQSIIRGIFPDHSFQFLPNHEPINEEQYDYGWFSSNSAKLLDNCMNSIHTLTEDCQSLQGFILLHSVADLSGSGFATALIRKLRQTFGKKYLVTFSLYPSAAARNGDMKGDTTSGVHRLMAITCSSLTLPMRIESEKSDSVLGMMKPNSPSATSCIVAISQTLNSINSLDSLFQHGQLL